MKVIKFNPTSVKPVQGTWSKPTAGTHEVVVKVHAAALNHRDLNITNSNNKNEFVYGSDGAGEIVEIGDRVKNWHLGDKVIINAQIGCMTCEHCLSGEHSLCTKASVLGGITWNGTLAEYVKVPVQNIERMPSHLDFIQAAALPLAFGTAWRALMTQANIKPHQTLLIHGIGGGVAMYALQIAASMGVKVIVTSSSNEKLQKAIELGAAAGINYRNEDVNARTMELTNNMGVDVAISSHAGTIPLSLDLLKLGGKVVQFAYLGENLSSFDIDKLMGKQLSLIGTSMNNYLEFKEGLTFINQTKFTPIVSNVYPFEEFESAFRTMSRGEQFGKIVVSIC